MAYTVVCSLALVFVFAFAAKSDQELALPPRPVAPKFVNSRFQNVTRKECTTLDYENTILSGRNGLRDLDRRWENFYVQPDIAFDEEELEYIEAAMDTLSQVIPCIEFMILPQYPFPNGDYVYIQKGTNGCYSETVGRMGKGQQYISLESPDCMHVGTIMHEMLHTLGLYHEQNRPDRDRYITIHEENIRRGFENNFVKLQKDFVSTYDVEYNTKSIMHYGSDAFSVNEKPTITTKNGKLIEPQRDHLEPTDILKLQRMYNCF